LKENGYSTSWFGKNHNTPAFAASQAGPFDQWPVGMGFDYFYGFVGGDAMPDTSPSTTNEPISLVIVDGTVVALEEKRKS
jgi:arylsulfatase A-like enzyme